MSESSSESLPESTLKTKTGPVTEMASLLIEPSLVKRRPNWLSLALKFWWVPASYFIPYLITFLIPVVNLKDGLMRANRVGSIGLLAAALVYMIWFIDCRFGARQIFGKSRDRAAKTLIYLLGIALWISWLGAGIVMTMSYDQVNSLPDLPAMRVP
jgi:hypothetical protein